MVFLRHGACAGFNGLRKPSARGASTILPYAINLHGSRQPRMLEPAWRQSMEMSRHWPQRLRRARRKRPRRRAARKASRQQIGAHGWDDAAHTGNDLCRCSPGVFGGVGEARVQLALCAGRFVRGCACGRRGAHPKACNACGTPLRERPRYGRVRPKRRRG